jgi:hypothetical protein
MLLGRPNSGSITITECDETEIIKLRLRTFALQPRALPPGVSFQLCWGASIGKATIGVRECRCAEAG